MSKEEKLKLTKKIYLGAGVAMSLIGIPVATYAATDTANTVITANIASVITVSTPANVAINITPTASGAASSVSDVVTVSTNNTAGYTLTLKDTDTTVTLNKGSDTIANHTGTFAAPSTLANNSWGYRVDGVGTFGAGPTSAQTNQPNLTGLWAGIKPSSGSDTIKTTAATATNDTTTVWYGVKVDSSKPNGAYTNTVVYTATTN